MNRQVKFLTKDQIERTADILLSEASISLSPPVPVDEILELHLGLSLDFDNLPERFGMCNVLGAIFIESKQVFVDESLDPDQAPNNNGRYRFTVAHEIGHWCLHRYLVESDRNQSQLFDDAVAKPTVICRSNETFKPVESQANHFAACLLMPRSLVFSTWKEIHPKSSQISLAMLQPHRTQILTSELLKRGSLQPGESEIDSTLLEHVARPLAERFQVSPQAMRLRLERLNLLSRQKTNNLTIPDTV